MTVTVRRRLGHAQVAAAASAASQREVGVVHAVLVDEIAGPAAAADHEAVGLQRADVLPRVSVGHFRQRAAERHRLERGHGGRALAPVLSVDGLSPFVITQAGWKPTPGIVRGVAALPMYVPTFT